MFLILFILHVCKIFINKCSHLIFKITQTKIQKYKIIVMIARETRETTFCSTVTSCIGVFDFFVWHAVMSVFLRPVVFDQFKVLWKNCD